MSVVDIACHYVSSSSSASVFICRSLNVPRSGSYLTYTNLKDGDCTLWTFYPAVSHHYLKRAMASMASHGFTEASTQVLITKKCSVHRALTASHPYVLVFWRVVWNTSCNPAALEVSCFLISTAWRTLWIKKTKKKSATDGQCAYNVWQSLHLPVLELGLGTPLRSPSSNLWITIVWFSTRGTGLQWTSAVHTVERLWPDSN
jgi:hypothetical protein